MEKNNNNEVPFYFESLAHEALINMIQVTGLVKTECKKLLSPILPSEAQYRILFLIHNLKKDLTQTDISRIMNVDKSNITALMKNLEKEKLVLRKRPKSDKRRFFVKLSKKGERVITELEARFNPLVAKLTANLSEEECKCLINLSHKIRDVITDNESE